MTDARQVTDHDEIRKWAEARGGEPAAVTETLEDDQDSAILRIKFQEEDGLEPISWEEFFEIFEEKDLAALLQDKTESGDQSRFSKFVSRH